MNEPTNSKDSDVDVRRGAAENPSCPADALALLAGVTLSEATPSDESQVGGAS
jgi:hypothetical protein